MQVHRAWLADGTPVAVKVQKPYIRAQMHWDLFCYRALVWCLDRAFELPMYWTGVMQFSLFWDSCAPAPTMLESPSCCDIRSHTIVAVDSICDTLTAEANFLTEAQNTKRAKVPLPLSCTDFHREVQSFHRSRKTLKTTTRMCRTPTMP